MRRPDPKDMWLIGALLLACTPDGGVHFDAPMSTGLTGLTGLTEPAEPTGSEAGTGADEATGDSAPPSTTLPPGDPDDTGAPSDSTDGEPPATGTLVPAHARWRYLASAGAPPPDWAAPSFDDATWPEGQAPFGEAGDAATTLDPAAAPLGVYLRRRFIATPGADTLMLYLRRGDGAAVYLNGAEVARSNLPDGALGPDTLAQDDLSGNEVLRYLRFAVPAAGLVSGENVIAVAVRRAEPGAAGLGFDLQAEALRHADLPTDALYAQWRTRSYGGEYGPDNVGVAWIEREGGGFVRTLTVWAEVRREHLVRWQSAADDNVVDAVTAATRGSHRTSEVTWDLRDAAGQPVAPGAYRLLLEFTEADSNKGEPPGPRLELPFNLGAGAGVVPVPAQPQYADVLVLTP